MVLAEPSKEHSTGGPAGLHSACMSETGWACWQQCRCFCVAADAGKDAGCERDGRRTLSAYTCLLGSCVTMRTEPNWPVPMRRPC